MLRALRNFGRNVAGVSSIEFAMITPVTVFLLFAEFDVYRFVMATQRVEVAAETVAQMVAATSASSSAVTTGDGVIDDADLNFYDNSEYFIYPDILTAPAVQQGQSLAQALEVDTTAIKMVKQGNGTYKPQTAWYSGTNNVRSCNTVYNSVADTSVSSPTTLPVDVIGPNSLIVVDVHTTFQPTFGASWLGNFQIVRSVYMPPRNVPFIEFNGTWMAVNC